MAKPWLPNRQEGGSETLSFAALRHDTVTLVIHFSGKYPEGSNGGAFAHRLVQICEELIDEVAPRTVVVDLSDLSYCWGDEIEWIYQIDRKVPQATVVSEKNRRALSTLEFGPQTTQDITDLDGVFDSVDTAISYLSKLRPAAP